MSSKESYTSSLTHLKKLLVWKLIERWVSMAILLSLFSIFCIRFAGQFLGEDIDLFNIYIIAFVGSSLVAVIYAGYFKKSLFEELVEADIRLKLRENLSTAYEIYQKERDSIFSELLYQNAAGIMKRFGYHHIQQRKFFPLYFLMALFLVLALFARVLDLGPGVSPLMVYTEKRAISNARQIEQLVEKELEEPERLKPESLEPVQQELKKLVKMMKDPTLLDEDAFQQMQQALSSVQAAQAAKMNNLGEKLSFGNKAESRKLKPLREGKVSPNELKQLEEQLGKMFENGVPESISRDISKMRQRQKLEEQLREGLEELSDLLKDKRANGESGAEEEEGFLISKSKTDQQSKAGELEDETNKQVLGSTQEKPDEFGSNDSSPSGSRPGEGDPSEGGHEPPVEDQTSSVGKDKSAWNKKTDSALAKSKKPQNKIDGISGQGSWFNVKIRSLTNKGDVTVTEEQVRRTYQRDMENTLLKEDIPLNMRNHIKNYFLSIGLRKEKK